MAEAVLKEELKKRKIRWYSVSSAGLRAEDGALMSANSRLALCEAGICVPDAFRARRLTPKMISEAYAVVCMTEEQAKEQAKDATFFGALMLKSGDADGLVSGACHSTANTLRPGLQIIKTAPGVKSVSSFNLMIAPAGGNKYMDGDVLVFADCGLNPTYTSEGLAECALATAESAKAIAGINPCVAMLSFSTMGSAKHDNVTLVQEATRIAKEKAPELALDGELQFDAALVPEVAAIKAPKSAVAGHANVFIFPDLQSGNIGYKIAERLGGFQAVGPICQGFAKPLNDLSRGCKASDIVLAVAITALQVKD